MPHAEELASPVHSRVMRNRNLDHSEAGFFKFFGHFNADHTASGLQRDRVENIPTKETKVAVDVADRKPKYESHRPPVPSADPNAIPRISALHFVSVDQVDIGFENGQQVVEFPNIVLTITIGVKNQIFPGVLKSADERRPISQIAFVMNHTKEGQFDGEPIEYGAGFVLASIVNNQDFEIGGDFADFFRNSSHDTLDRVLVIVRWEKCSE